MKFVREFLHSSKYSQKMRRLSCKIFNEFYTPELSKKELDYGSFHPPVTAWYTKMFSDYRAWERCQERPLDLNPARNYKYYPSHPQIRALAGTLRDYGLYRDEHRDFNEEMKAIAISRGKVFRERRGKISKKK